MKRTEKRTEEKQTSSPNRSRGQKEKGLVATVAGLGGAALLAAALLHPSSTAEGVAAPNPRVVAAQEVANRYEGKTLSVEDNAGMVTVVVETQDRERAKPFLKEYADGTPKASEVIWEKPIVAAKIVEDGGFVTDITEGTWDAVPVDSGDQQMTNIYEPGLVQAELAPDADLADGTKAEIYIRGWVTAYNMDLPEPNKVLARGLTPLGMMQKQDGEWHLIEAELPDAPVLSSLEVDSLQAN